MKLFKCLGLAFLLLGAVEPNAQTVSASGLSLNATRQEQDFRAIMRSRDAQISTLNEMRRIVLYAENLEIRVLRHIEEEKSNNFSDQIRRELDRLLSFERRFFSSPQSTGPQDSERRLELLLAFDRDFPLGSRPALSRYFGVPGNVGTPFFGSPPLVSGSPALGLNAFNPGVASIIIELQTTLTDLRQNLSPRHNEWPVRFERQLRSINFSSIEISTPRLDELPHQFHLLTSAGSFENMSDLHVTEAIQKYRTALNDTIPALERRIDQINNFRLQVSQELQKLKEDANRSFSDYQRDLEFIENSISQQARSIFGSNVGSDIFVILLYVFGGVFALIMVAPKIYGSTVADNLLKAEFLLQFSTVFVLTSAIVILGIGQFIEKDQLPVLLAGISGYVLGQLGRVGGAPTTARAPSPP